MSTIFFELSLIAFIVFTTWPTTSPPWMATVLALAASRLACLAYPLWSSFVQRTEGG